jgi:hypothetical protein
VPRKVQKNTKVSSINGVLAIEEWPIERPKDYPLNARKWTAQALDKVANSLQEYGWRQPLVCDADDVLIIGHLRRSAARDVLGWKTAPVHVARDLTPAQVRGLRLADNRTHDEAEWDTGILRKELGELRGLKVDLAPLGFDDADFARIFKEAMKPPAELAISAELFERQDYIVVSVENKFDWQVLSEKLGIETTICPPNGSSTITHRRVCRVISAERLLKALK